MDQAGAIRDRIEKEDGLPITSKPKGREKKGNNPTFENIK
jgi:hypothetical protein